jgi:hypothetical protein
MQTYKDKTLTNKLNNTLFALVLYIVVVFVLEIKYKEKCLSCAKCLNALRAFYAI